MTLIFMIQKVMKWIIMGLIEKYYIKELIYIPISTRIIMVDQAMRMNLNLKKIEL